MRLVALTVIVTRDVAARYRGFLASLMLEIAPGVYISPNMNSGVRIRVWNVVEDWHTQEAVGNVVMVWRDSKQTGGIGIRTLGVPIKHLAEIDGMWVTRRYF